MINRHPKGCISEIGRNSRIKANISWKLIKNSRVLANFSVKVVQHDKYSY